MKRSLLFLLAIFAWSLSFATHNRAGEITYRCLDPVNAPYTFEITVTTYTKASSQADRCDLTVYFGDGDSAIFLRSNGTPDPSQCALPALPGQVISIVSDTKYNTYKGIHTYPGPGSYWISMLDPNRNANIENIPNSVNVPFYIRSMLVINPFLGVNNSPVLLNPPIDFACENQCFVHNPGAVDADGDSIAYELVSCLGDQGQTIPSFTYPPTIGGGTNSLDPITGDYVWCSPANGTQNTEWNIAILIKEYRKPANSNQYYLVGSVLRDMQITVKECNNNPPIIAAVKDTCVIAGETVSFNVSASDPDAGNTVTLTATGGPFLTAPQATFNAAVGNPATGAFTWVPGCDRIRAQPYQVTIKAEDSDASTPLVDYETVQIRVIGPPPVNLTANPQGTSILIDWDASQCTTGVTGYLIYRRESCDPWTPDHCQTGVPASSGYTLIGNTAYNVTIFNDDNNGQGLIHGVDYSYIVVAVYADGSQSLASEQTCAQLVRDVPIITHVSVTTTSTANGAILVKWVKPLVGANDLDTIANPGPYRFELQRATGFTSSSFATVANFTSPFFSTLNDTMYLDTLFDTETTPYTYKINFYYTVNGNEVKLGSTHTASSVYLNIAPSDNMLTLTWQEFVPWSNYKYYVYKETSPNVFTLLTVTPFNVYMDDSLLNGVTYCYKILAEGEYSDTTIVSPLLNWSEIKCAQPQDLTPPCPPTLTVTPDCNAGQNTLVWTNPNNYCADDVVQYNIYYTPVQGGAYQLLTTITDATDTSYVFVNPESIAGCFMVTALDTFMNESANGTEFCIDNCPVYELPNVFTPDGDNVNDFFIPFPYKYVESIDLKIYDRWGLLMFETTDPDIRWDGTNMETKQKCTAGVYYYTCTVNEIRVYGIRERKLTGFIHLFPGKTNPN